MTPVRRIAVLKFGGTSMADAEVRALAAERVAQARDDGYAVVAVVSAMGRAPAPYATDSLLALVGGDDGSPNADLAAACGEMLAAAVFAQELRAAGIEARALTGAQAGIRTDGRHGNAAIRRIDPSSVVAVLDRGAVAVVAGYQGAADDGTITTLGRGGSDLTAIALGSALGAERIDIYTDVQGVMTADPRRISAAETIARVTFEEMSELAHLGARVMHHRAAHLAHERGVPYAIRDVRSGVGTIVDDTTVSERPVTGVTLTAPMSWVHVERESGAAYDDATVGVLGRIAASGISIDQVALNGKGIAFAVHGRHAAEVAAILREASMPHERRDGCAKLSVIGAGMRGRPGVVHAVISALAGARIPIVHATDSHITISVLVPEEYAARAEQVVHDHFGLGRRAETG